ATQDIEDLAGNAFDETNTTEDTYTIDNTPPNVTQIIRKVPASATTNATSVTFEVTFDEDVTNVGDDDFEISATSTATGSIAPFNVTTYSTTFDEVVSSVSGDGDILNLDFVTSPSIVDEAGISFLGAITGTEEEYIIDNTPPKVLSIKRQVPTSEYTNASSVTFRVTFSEDIDTDDLDPTDFTLA